MSIPTDRPAPPKRANTKCLNCGKKGVTSTANRCRYCRVVATPVGLARTVFPDATDEQLDWLLWERTAFPMCGMEHALGQLVSLRDNGESCCCCGALLGRRFKKSDPGDWPMCGPCEVDLRNEVPPTEKAVERARDAQPPSEGDRT